LIDGLGITPYQLMKRTKISPTTAYALYNDPTQLPSSTTLAKICDTFKIQPGEVLEWIPPEEKKAVTTKKRREKGND
jgi:DNA-binding Xre family transcriptional regulator